MRVVTVLGASSFGRSALGVGAGSGGLGCNCFSLKLDLQLTDRIEIVDEFELTEFDASTLDNEEFVVAFCDEQFVANGDVVIGCPSD